MGQTEKKLYIEKPFFIFSIICLILLKYEIGQSDPLVWGSLIPLITIQGLKFFFKSFFVDKRKYFLFPVFFFVIISFSSSHIILLPLFMFLVLGFIHCLVIPLITPFSIIDENPIPEKNGETASLIKKTEKKDEITFSKEQIDYERIIGHIMNNSLVNCSIKYTLDKKKDIVLPLIESFFFSLSPYESCEESFSIGNANYLCCYGKTKKEQENVACEYLVYPSDKHTIVHIKLYSKQKLSLNCIVNALKESFSNNKIFILEESTADLYSCNCQTSTSTNQASDKGFIFCPQCLSVAHIPYWNRV